MTVLVAVASKHGSTAEIAQVIGARLRGRGLETRVLAAEDVQDLVGVEAVVLGSAIYAGRWLSAAKRLVQRFGAEMAALPVWLFSSGPTGDPPKPTEDPANAQPMLRATNARDHRVFAGRLDSSRLGLGERLIIRAVRARDGDFRDWAEITHWADGIADSLLLSAARPAAMS